MPNNDAIDTKPIMDQVLDLKPNNNDIFDTNFTYLETRSISAGQPIGLLLSLTYPANMTFTGARI